MEVMTNSTQRQSRRALPTSRSLFLFVTSIARTNLETEIIQRGGSLCSNNVVRYKPKRDCIGELCTFKHTFYLPHLYNIFGFSSTTVPLLNLLSVHLRVLAEWPLWKSFATLCGLSNSDNNAPVATQETIPTILADPIALMIKFTLLAPLHMDIGKHDLNLSM